MIQLLYSVWMFRRLVGPSSLPNVLPRTAKHKVDPHNPLPGGAQLGPPSGDMYLGVERQTKKQVWFKFNDWLRHGLITGTTGSGKTELLIAIAYNFLCAGGSGLMFADPKGDPKAALKLAWIAKRFGREDDLLICNYISPENLDVGILDYQATNTSNPTQTGNAKEVANMLTSLLPKNEGGNNAVFADNAITLAQVLSRCLVDLRDKDELTLSWGVFRDHLNLPACIELARHPSLDIEARRELELFVYGIAGVSRTKGAHDQVQTAYDQFGYFASYCQRGLATLTGSFGYIYDCKYGDFSYDDVVNRQRILLTVLPSLQSTQDEMSLLGRIDLFGKKQALAEGLAKRLEGSGNQVQRDQPEVDGVPSLNIMDEYKYISVPGMSVAATQGRSLGWASLVGVQSYAGLCVDGEAEADEWLENTSTKLIGSAQGDSTFDKINSIVGQEFVARSEGRTQTGAWFAGTADKMSLSYEKQDILDIRDIRAQIEGEFTLIVRDREIRMHTLYVDTTSKEQSHQSLLMNSFIDLPPPNPLTVEAAVLYSKLFDGTLLEGLSASTDAKHLQFVSRRLKAAKGQAGTIYALLSRPGQ